MNFCLFCWLDPIEKAWTIYNAFIDYNFEFGGLHRLGAMWIVFHIWTDIILIVFVAHWLIGKWRKK